MDCNVIPESKSFTAFYKDYPVSQPHEHSCFELSYVVSGSVVHRFENETKTISAGDYFIVDYNQIHGYRAIDGENFKIINIQFLSEFIDPYLKKCRNFAEIVNLPILNPGEKSKINANPSRIIFSDDDRYILSLFERILEEFENKESGYNEIIRLKLTEIILLTIRKHSAIDKLCSDELCNALIDYAYSNLNNKNLLGNFAKEHKVNLPYLSKRFKLVLGVKFSDYLKSLRIKQCTYLLLSTNKKIIDIASLCGYSDMKFFYKIFKEFTGMSPSEYRNIHSKTNN